MPQPVVFISYARQDGEDWARNIYKRLQNENVEVWMDRFGLEGGRSWWLQIEEVLQKAQFLVLIGM